MPKNYYETLGIKENTTDQEIEKVYQQLSPHHRDRKEGTGEKFQAINSTYEKLTNSNKKTNFKKNRPGEKNFFKRHFLKSEVLETKRVVKVTKGGRRFSFTSLSLFKDEEQKKIAFSHQGGKEIIISLRKASEQAQKKLINYWPYPRRTIPHDIQVSYKATKIFFKPSPPGHGIRAGYILNKLFKYLEIKDVSTKIIGSRNKLNVIRAGFLALDELTGKKYNY